MKNICYSLAMVSLVVGFAACSKSSSSPSTASVMYVNGCAGTTNVNASLNGTVVSSAQNLAFLRNTGYLSATAASDNITFTLSNLGTPLTSGSRNFAAGSNYSVYAGGLVTSPMFVTLQDDLSSPGASDAKVRFVNLSPDNLSETVYVGTIVIDSAITSGNSGGFVQVAGGNYVIKAGDPSNISTVVSTASMPISSGRIYTVILTGTGTGSGTSGLNLTVINNN